MEHPTFNMEKRGFTLIELLVVIAIIAILSVVVILTLNPAELLKQSRDSNRISDLSTLKTAISLYLTDSASPKLASSTPGFTACYLSSFGSNATTSARCGVFDGTNITTNDTSTQALYRKVDSTGWLPIDFSKMSAGTPFGTLPSDPANNLVNYYSYAASSSNVFEIDAFMESTKFQTGINNAGGNDGGSSPTIYEVGTNLFL